MMRVKKVQSLQTDVKNNPSSSFNVSKKELSSHIMTLSFNNYLQKDFYDRKLVGFVGAGLGLGYAFPWDKKLTSGFALPVFSLHLGLTMMMTSKTKFTIAWRCMYMTYKLANKWPFVDKNNRLYSTRAITAGDIKIKDLFIQGLTFEYKFYMA